MSKNLFKRTVSLLTSAAVTLGAAASVLSVSPVINASAANVDTSDYAKALQYSLYFYDANMCGDQVGETSHVTWRDDCHTYSDVPGGFHDAGDHVMFGLPQGYSASTIGWSYYEYSDVYKELGLVTHFKTISDYFCQYFKDCTKLSNGTVTNFMYEAGEGNTDHSYWGPPETQSQSQWGRCLWTSNGASNIAAQYAAALAISYMNFGNEEDLTYAKALFNFANQYRSNYSVAPFYQSSGCEDDIAWAAGWLYLATNDSTYKNTFSSTKPSYVGWTYCWDNVSLGCAILDGYINNNWSTAGNYISEKVNSSQSSYWFLQQWGSARYNTALQFCALVVSNNSSYDFTSWAKWQMTYILGGNGAKACFISGLGDNSAKYPHHRAASGYEGWDGTNGVNGKTGFSSSGHTLIGALVGGPTDSGGTYTDSVNDYTANEITVDYNAGCVGALAGLYDVYGTGSVVTYINDETEVCLDTQAPTTYSVTSSADNCTVSLSTATAIEGDTVTFTLNPTVENPVGPNISVTTASGVTVNYTESNGTYSFTMPAENVTVSASYEQGAAIVYGDANGDGKVNATDATLVSRHSVNVYTLSDDALTRCDVNGDGRINATDATLISRFAVNLIDKLPI